MKLIFFCFLCFFVFLFFFVQCHSCTISPDDRYALAGISDGTLVQFEIPSGKQLLVFSGHGGSVSINLFDW
jgi:hypothetical protein